jgi:hypothetical protein
MAEKFMLGRGSSQVSFPELVLIINVPHVFSLCTLRSGVKDYVIFLITLYDIIFW